MIKPRDTGLTRVWKATLYSIQGLKAAWLNESAFRQECTIAVILFKPLVDLTSFPPFSLPLIKKNWSS